MMIIYLNKLITALTEYLASGTTTFIIGDDQINIVESDDKDECTLYVNYELACIYTFVPSKGVDMIIELRKRDALLALIKKILMYVE